MRRREDRVPAVADRPDEETSFPAFTDTTPTLLTPPASGRRSVAADAPDRGTFAESSLDRRFDAVLTSALFDEALIPSRRPANAGVAPVERPPLIDTAPKGGGGGGGGPDAASGGGGGGNGAASARGGETGAGANAVVAASNGARLAGTGTHGAPVASGGEFSSSSGSPLAISDNYPLWTGVGTSVGGNVGDNDSVPAGSTFVVLDQPDVGDLQFDPGGSFTYTLQSDYHRGEDSFVYRLWSGGVSSTAWVRLDLSDDPPLAMPDEYLGAIAGVPFEVTGEPGGHELVTANDIEYDDEPVTDATVVTGPTYGSVSLDPGGSFTYTANADYFGWDSFTYICSDGKNFSQPETVWIGVNDVHIFRDGVDVTEGGSYAIVGQRVALYPDFVGPGFGGKPLPAIDNPQWTIPGYGNLNWVFDGYLWTTPRGEVDDLEGEELAVINIDYYWGMDVDGDVEFEATINGHAVTAKATFDVRRPTSTFTTALTPHDPPVDVGNQGDGQIALHYGTIDADENAGINWICTVTPTADGGGVIAFVQLIKTHRTLSFPEGIYIRSSGDDRVLDWNKDRKEVTYNPPKPVLAGQQTPLKDRDSPSQLRGEQQAGSVEESFQTFLMYKPNGADSVYVTLRHLVWYWKGAATSTPGGGLRIGSRKRWFIAGAFRGKR